MAAELNSIAQRFLAAQAIAKQSGDLMKRRFYQRDPFEISSKGPQDYVTSVDHEVEELVISGLREAFRDDTFIAEERGGTCSRSLWVIDPIDGTANFARHIPHFCISMAYLIDGKPILGVTFDPIRDEMFTGISGGGAFLNGLKLQVSAASALEHSQVEVGSSLHSGTDTSFELAHRVANLGAGVTNAGSGALGIAYVAAGRLDAYCETHIRAWDVLAGIVLVDEAGGFSSDFLGGNGLTEGNPFLACTRGLQEVLLSATGLGI
ncbi:inositol monophosphatase family protein [Tardiphaga sp. OK245]|uniref:inositol monophosphatase family protein n=1 Tax=Tardiphaga sp. OK245 TaxID=1855306 RepID=UPI0008A72945|nr:inositol monophosphatase family protein [Tardiphaga sp. OK245]SEH40741.1 myo-inositol-1(or 4)-monophosphatase [Tardiphaga sp. OK245]